MNFTTKWIKTGKVHDFAFLGKEVIATAAGNHVTFYNLATKERRIEYFNGEARGEGACCLAGHSVIPIFCTAERRCNPKIIVHTYPDIRKVSECRLDRGPNSYVSCSFAGTEYLLSLTSFPKFSLIIWLWRTGEKVSSVDTMITDEVQTIEAFSGTPRLAYHHSPISGKLWTYEVYGYSKKVSVVKNCVKQIECHITSVCWTSSANLLLCDEFKNVYVVASDGKKLQLVLRGEVADDGRVVAYSDGFVLGDRTSLSYYSKSVSEGNDVYNLVGSIRCASRPIKMARSRHKETILIHSEGGTILELSLGSDNRPVLEELVSEDCGKVIFMCSLSINRDYCILIDDTNNLIVASISDGAFITDYEIDKDDAVTCVASHPHVPLIAASTSTGKCMFFAVSDDRVNLLEMLYLQREALDKVKFSKNGTSLAATASRRLFLAKTIVREAIDVLSYLQPESGPIIDFLLYERDDCDTLEVILLVQAAAAAAARRVGDSVELYSFDRGTKSFANGRRIDLRDFYQGLEYGMDSGCDFLASPYLSNELHLFKFEDIYETIDLVNIVPVKHKLRKFNLSVFRNYVITNGYDGMTILRECSDLSETVEMLSVHHYREKGSKCVTVSNNGEMVVCLGKNGSLVGLQLRAPLRVKSSAKTKNIIRNWKRTSPIEIPSQSWLEREKSNDLEKEKDDVSIDKSDIADDFEKLKIKVKNLLDENESKSIERQLPISSFDLDTRKRKRKIDQATLSQNQTKLALQEKISQNERTIDYLMSNFWNSLQVHDCTLVTFNGKIYIENYPFRCDDRPETTYDSSVDLFNTPVYNENVKLGDNIEVHMLFAHLEGISADESEGNLGLKYGNELAFTGSTSFEWIADDSPPNQLATLDRIVDSCSRENRLKAHFNLRFEEMKALKSRVLQDTGNRLALINRCKSELRTMFPASSEDDEFDRIKWHSSEIPENVITVTHDDVTSVLQSDTFSPDIEDETQNDASLMMLKEVVSLSEREVAFRRGKLEEMMDGVLEIRWEDEIKKDVPKPDCMLSKNPSKYNQIDLRAIEIYKRKVQKLEADRLKYKKHLEEEIRDTKEKIRADVVSFDERMQVFVLEKIKVQSALLQEFLLRVSARKASYLADHTQRRIQSLTRLDLNRTESENYALQSEMARIDATVAELRNRCENLSKREKTLEGKFRGEFAELKQPMVEHLLRQYKRRPRMGQVASTSLTCSTELTKCLMLGKKSLILPREYLDVLRGMNSLDVMPSSLPPQIDANHWQTLCRLRRNKVEVEIKLRTTALELAEAEQSYVALQKLSAALQSKIYAIKGGIEEETMKQSMATRNRDVQLVLKAAQIEIPIGGRADNFESTCVVAYQKLIEVNAKIIREGEKKIVAMRELMALKKSIRFRLWRSQCVTKKLGHSRDHLCVLQATKISREMQNFLVERLEGRIRYRDAASCNKMLGSVKKKFHRMLREQRKDFARMIREIKFWQKQNTELIAKISQISMKKSEQCANLEDDYLRKRNEIFHKSHLHSIMERNRLVERVEKNCNELFAMQTQLELLKLKTYPTLRFKDASYCERHHFLARSR